MVKALLFVTAGALAFLILAQTPQVDDQTAIQIAALNRLKGVDLESNASLKSAVLKVLEKTRGTPHFVELVREFNLKGHGPALLDYALKFPNESSGVEAFRLAADELGRPAIESLLPTKDGLAAVQLIGNSNDKELQQTLRVLVRDIRQSLPLRKEALKALAQSEEGARYVITLEQKSELPADLKLAAA